MVVESAGPDETEAAGAALAARLAPGDVVLVSGRAGRREDHLRSRSLPRARSDRAGHEPHVHDRDAAAGAATWRWPTSTSTGSPTLSGEDPALLDDYLTPDRIAFVEWPGVAEDAPMRVAARVRLEHLGWRPAADRGGMTALLGLDTSTAASTAAVLRAGRAGLRGAPGARAPRRAARARERADAGGARGARARGAGLRRARRDRGRGGPGRVHRAADRDRHRPGARVVRRRSSCGRCPRWRPWRPARGRAACWR